MDAMIQEFSLALAAEGKRVKTIKICTDAARWLQRTQGIRLKTQARPPGRKAAEAEQQSNS